MLNSHCNCKNIPCKLGFKENGTYSEILKVNKHSRIIIHLPYVYIRKYFSILVCFSPTFNVLPLFLLVTSELVMLSLDLVKTRLSVMSMEMRKNFIQVILTSLIEKSPDPKILRAVVKIVEEWVKNNSPMAANQVKLSDTFCNVTL